MGTQLSVNLNKVALLRNSRNFGIPSVTKAARMVLDAGAYGVTVHPAPTNATFAMPMYTSWTPC